MVVKGRMKDQLCNVGMEGRRQMKMPGKDLKGGWTMVKAVGMERKEREG